MSGWPGRLLKEWTVVATSVVGTGLPETPVYLAAVPGTGYTGTIRPNPTGAPISMSRGSQHLNPAAYTAPLSGPVGNSGQKLDHRSQPVQPRQLCRPNFPPQRALLPRPEGGGNQHAESPRFYRLEHDREQHAIRSSA